MSGCGSSRPVPAARRKARVSNKHTNYRALQGLLEGRRRAGERAGQGRRRAGRAGAGRAWHEGQAGQAGRRREGQGRRNLPAWGSRPPWRDPPDPPDQTLKTQSPPNGGGFGVLIITG